MSLPTLPRIRRASIACTLVLSAGSALAQGGPPVITDDPGTPGDGHWEINLGAIQSRTANRRELAAPDADINYGWGEHLQLKADIPLVTATPAGEASRTGLGQGNFGVKWRFVDEEQAGFALSTYPQYTRGLVSSSDRRDITSPGRSFFLPLELSAAIGRGFSIAADVGRNFVSGADATSTWQAGFVLAHDCVEGVECLAEIHETRAPGEHQTLLNVGLRWKLQDSLTLLSAAGREFGTAGGDQLHSLVYVGLQFTR